jgi:hypothetical protein
MRAVNHARAWKRRRLLAKRWLGAAWTLGQILLFLGACVFCAGRAIWWLATSPGRDVAAVLVAIGVAAALLAPMPFLIRRLEKKPMWCALPALMLLMLWAAVVFCVAALSWLER